MYKIFSSKYNFLPEMELKYIEWMFARNRKLILWVAIVVVAFIFFVTSVSLINDEMSLDFNLILIFRIIMICLTLMIFYVFRQETPLRAQYILFIDMFLIIIINTIDNYACLKSMDNVLSPAVQMFSLYLFMLVPFISFLQKFVLGGVFILGLVFCIMVLDSANSADTLFFVLFIFVAEMLVYYRMECLSRAQFKANIDDKKQNEDLNKSRQELKEALSAEREMIKQNQNFIDMISHEYRTPISVITTSLDSLETLPVINNSQQADNYVQMIRRASSRLLSIYESSLYENKINISGFIPDKKSFEILKIIETAVEFTRSIYPEHHICIDDDIIPDAMIIADSELLTTSIINILDNACKYSKPSNIEVKLSMLDSSYIIEISDSGSGIDKSEEYKVFEKYYRSERTKQKPGAGVGLYLVRKIIELHGGRIEIKSLVRVGTTITISLPFAEDEDNE